MFCQVVSVQVSAQMSVQKSSSATLYLEIQDSFSLTLSTAIVTTDKTLVQTSIKDTLVKRSGILIIDYSNDMYFK